MHKVAPISGHADFESVFVRRAKLCYNPPCVCPARPITFHLVFPVLLLEEKILFRTASYPSDRRDLVTDGIFNLLSVNHYRFISFYTLPNFTDFKFESSLILVYAMRKI